MCIVYRKKKEETENRAYRLWKTALQNQEFIDKNP
jgi:hypothetical protein